LKIKVSEILFDIRRWKSENSEKRKSIWPLQCRQVCRNGECKHGRTRERDASWSSWHWKCSYVETARL